MIVVILPCLFLMCWLPLIVNLRGRCELAERARERGMPGRAGVSYG